MGECEMRLQSVNVAPATGIMSWENMNFIYWIFLVFHLKFEISVGLWSEWLRHRIESKASTTTCCAIFHSLFLVSISSSCEFLHKLFSDFWCCVGGCRWKAKNTSGNTFTIFIRNGFSHLWRARTPTTHWALISCWWKWKYSFLSAQRVDVKHQRSITRRLDVDPSESYMARQGSMSVYVATTTTKN